MSKPQPGDGIKVDFKHFIKLTKGNIMSWDSLSNLLNETTSTLNLSKELNNILLEELKSCETNLSKSLAKEKENERIVSNANVESKSIGIQTEDLSEEKEIIEVLRNGHKPIDKLMEKKNSQVEIPSVDNEERSFVIKQEDEIDILLPEKGSEQDSSKELILRNETSPNTTEDIEEEGFKNSKMKHENLTDPLDTSMHQEACENNTEVKDLEGDTNHIEESKSEIDEQKQIEPPPGTDLGIEPENSIALTKHGNVDMNKDPYKCRICSKVCISNSDLRVHKQSHAIASQKYLEQQYQNKTLLTNEPDINEKFQCEQCHIIFESKSALNRHRNLHKDQNLYECKTCSKACLSKKALREHEIKHSGERPFQCLECKKAFKRSSNLSEHLKIHKGERPFECKTCKKRFPKSNTLKNHERTHTGERPFACQTCNKTFSQKGSLIYHERNHTGENLKECKFCKKLFSRGDDHKNHERRHTGEKPFICKICGKASATSSDMTNHEKTHNMLRNRSRTYQCEDCGKTFYTSDVLKRHLSTHTEEKPYECKICHQSFAQSHTLTNHIRTHTGEKPFECEICHKTFTGSSSFYSHKKNHLGEKPHKCKLCEKCFFSPHDLRRHLRRHTGERSHECKTCFKGFFGVKDLKDHERTHTGEKPFECKFCDRKFSWPKSLKNHIKVHDEKKVD